MLAFQLAGLVFVSVIVVLRWHGPPATSHLLYGFLAGTAGAVGLGALYKAMSVGAITRAKRKVEKSLARYRRRLLPWRCHRQPLSGFGKCS